MARPTIERNADGRPRVWMSKRGDGQIAWAMHPAAMPRVAASVDTALFTALDQDLETHAVIIWEGSGQKKEPNFDRD